MHSSDTLVTHSGISPAARYRATTVASLVAMVPTRETSPDVWGIPLTAKHSFTEQGTPVNGGSSPAGLPRTRHAATARSASTASRLASSYRVAHTAFRNAFARSFCVSQRSSAALVSDRWCCRERQQCHRRTCWINASTTCADDTVPSRMRAASCVAELATMQQARSGPRSVTQSAAVRARQSCPQYRPGVP